MLIRWMPAARLVLSLHAAMTNAEIADAFDEMADLLEFQGANAFRVRAYRSAARTLKDLPQLLSSMVAEGEELTAIDGVGKDLAAKIESLVQTGALNQLEELRSLVPEGALKMLRIPGVGPKKAAAIHKELGVATLVELRTACEAGKIRDLKGFGAKSEQTILEGLELAEKAGDRKYWCDADALVDELRKHLSHCKAIEQFEFAGSYRRGKETVGDLDVLAVANDGGAARDHFLKFPAVDSVIVHGGTKLSVRLKDGFQVDLRIVPPESFGAALQYFTGSQAHNVVLRGMAKKDGLKLNEYGVYRGDEQIAGASEEEVYAVFDLPVIPPELRENRIEYGDDPLPELIELGDLVGDLHMHTTESDGKATLGEMAAAAKARGLKYIAITDHSKRVGMANGLDGDRLRSQWEDIDELNDRLEGIRLLKGVEVDILEAGPLDIEDEVLAEADWVVASVHYGQKQPREQITERIVGALENPHVSAVAHPTGRLLNRRPRYEVDLDAVYEAAAVNGKALELNANPARLDLDDAHCAAAKRHGIPIVINSDAHSTEGLGVLRYGVLQARRAGLTKEDVLNTRSWNAVKKLIRRG